MTGMIVSKVVNEMKPALTVTWTPPQSDMDVTQYQLQYKTGMTSWEAASLVTSRSSTSTVLEALAAGTAYQVRIRAVSIIGNGTWSKVESETTFMGELSNEIVVQYFRGCLSRPVIGNRL